jgi:hypothetical protein
VFVFKMSVDLPGSDVELMKMMQVGRDMENSWIMFDHVKRLKDWTTMTCHVYDRRYCKVLTIECCDMQSEDYHPTLLHNVWHCKPLITRTMCNAKVGSSKHDTPAPTYKGFNKQFRSTNNVEYEFWFCPDDIKRCVSDTKKKYVLDWPTVPNTWLVKKCVNLSREEVLALETPNFNYNRGMHCPLFVGFQQYQPFLSFSRIFVCH